MNTDFRITETTALLAELSTLSEENKKLRDELTAADLMCDLLQRELTDLKLKLGALT